ncbi:MAG: hypothetical protein AB7O65_00555, partial [Candidatus Korobacteraceae bacterium]
KPSANRTPVPRPPLPVTQQPPSDLAVVIFSESVRGEPGRAFVREVLARVPDASVFYVDQQMAGILTEPILAAMAKAKAVLVPVYVVPISGKAVQLGDEMKNTVSLIGDSDVLMRRLLEAAGDRMAVIALGNPYLAADYPGISTYVCTFSNLPVSETAAVKALFGEVPIGGRLPVTIPQVAQRGEGIDLLAPPSVPVAPASVQ